MTQTKIWGRGQITIPVRLRRELRLDDEQALEVFRVGKSLVLTPKKLLGDSLAHQVEKEMKKEGLSLEDLLSDLRKERARYRRERNG
ncbi:MAG: AbrB/MazE/SpoVT family DNA-binding domain-containing protein [Proteobacteria bacterium]|nr:AbrB/MazE/SpoVT family DNA-binding domain-containing protein [Pseudomonadota bacterium]